MQPERLSITPEMRQCIEATSACYSACAETLGNSLDGGGLADRRHVRVLVDCCEVLQATQNALLRGSKLSILLATVCVEACEGVSESYRRLERSDELLASSAEACDETAECCRRLMI